MKHAIYTLTIVGTLIFVSGCDSLQQASKNLPKNFPTSVLTNQEVIDGLKTALRVSTDTSVNRLSALNGYMGNALLKIMLPPEAKTITDNLAKIPGGQEILDKTITALNRAAEDAATEAAPIFKNAIANMSIQDAFGILRGADTAATGYLRKNTFTDLKSAFSGKISTSLGKPIVFGQSAESLYSNLISVYNVASLNGSRFPKITQNTLSDYVTDRALQGLFLKVAEEEKQIRENTSHRVTEQLRKVFAQQ